MPNTTMTVTLAYPGLGDAHPAGQWCVDYVDATGDTHHGHVTSAALFPVLPAEVRRPLKQALRAARDEMQATTDMLTAERQAYRSTVTVVTADLDVIPDVPA